MVLKTDSDEDVIFVSELFVPKSTKEIKIDRAKRLALQTDIDQLSQPTLSAKPTTATVDTLMKTKMKKNDGDKVQKKEKKHKKVKRYKAEDKSYSDEKSQDVMKKEKKGKKNDKIIKEEEKCWNKTEMKEKKKKKCKNVESFSVIDLTNGEDDQEWKWLKTKKLLADDGNQVKHLQSSVEEEKLEVKQKTKKKGKNKAIQSSLENIKQEKEDEEKTRKKGKKDKVVQVISSEGTEYVKEKKRKKVTRYENLDEVTLTKPKKRIKVEKNELNVVATQTECEVKLEKKVKKEVKTEEFENGLEPIEVGENKKSLKRKNKLNKSSNEEIFPKDDKVKSKNKKEKCKKSHAEEGKDEEVEPKKKKSRLKKCKAEAEDHNVSSDAAESKKKKKKKKTSMKEEPEVYTAAEAGAKKKRFKEQGDSQEVAPEDVVFLSMKTGNTDEVAINRERRKALQVEIDEASQPENPSKQTGFGQWSTAQFDSSEQQQKFLRLMGGFKKGTQTAGSTAGGANMALGRHAQQQLQQGLLGEFERAHTRRTDFSGRGAGLGFTAPSNKKLSIDVNACRSVRFED